MLGIGKVFQLLEKEGLLTDSVKQDIGAALYANFEDSDRLHLDIKEQFAKDYESNYKGMNAMEKVASGIIDVYNRHYDRDLGITKPFEISMPIIKNTVKETV
jgi:hypothetical protein